MRSAEVELAIGHPKREGWKAEGAGKRLTSIPIQRRGKRLLNSDPPGTQASYVSTLSHQNTEVHLCHEDPFPGPG